MRHLHRVCGHRLNDVLLHPDGRNTARCDCGWRSVPLLSPRIACDIWRSHHLDVTGEHAP